MKKHPRHDLVCGYCERTFTSRAACPFGGPYCSNYCAKLGRLAAEAEARLPKNAVVAYTAGSGWACYPVDYRSFTALADALVELDDALDTLPRSMERDALVLHRDAIYAAWSAMAAPDPLEQPARMEGVA